MSLWILLIRPFLMHVSYRNDLRRRFFPRNRGGRSLWRQDRKSAWESKIPCFFCVETMDQMYWPFLLYFVLVLAMVTAMLVASFFLGERHRERNTCEPYESGIKPTGSTSIRLSIKFYLVALFFVILKRSFTTPIGIPRYMTRVFPFSMPWELSSMIK